MSARIIFQGRCVCAASLPLKSCTNICWCLWSYVVFDSSMGLCQKPHGCGLNISGPGLFHSWVEYCGVEGVRYCGVDGVEYCGVDGVGYCGVNR